MGSLRPLLEPESVAVVGANDDATTFGGRAWRHLTRAFRGTAIPVNRRQDALRSPRRVMHLREVPLAPDVVVLATPAETVPDLLEEAATIGAHSAVVFAQCSPGITDTIRRIADLRRLTVLGPSCLGLIHANASVALSSSVSLERRWRQGPLAFVGQSGALMGVIHARSIDLGLGLGLCVSTGGQAQVRVEDVLAEIADRDDVRAVGAYLEDLDVDRLVTSVKALQERDVRVVALKGGLTGPGSRAATAHSGALASDGRAFRQLAKELGVIVAEDPDELLLMLAATATKGRRWRIASVSGGLASVAADHATRLGLELPSPGSGSSNAGGRGSYENPADLDATGASTADKLATLRAMASDSDVDGVLVIVNDMPGVEEFLDELAPIAGNGLDRILVVSACSEQFAHAWRVWTDRGSTFFTGLVPTLRAIARVQRCEPQISRAVLSQEAHLLAPADTVQLLVETGVPALASVEVNSEGEACEAAERLGYPVVLKVARTEHRGQDRVRTNLGSCGDVSRAFRELAAEMPIAVQAQATVGLEFYVGVVRDPTFGYLLLVGAGGPDVEEMAEVAVGRGPLAAPDIEALISSTSVGRWVQSPASRGMVNIPALVRVAGQALEIAAGLGSAVESVDFNPVVVNADGAIVVDAKVRLAEVISPRPPSPRGEQEYAA